MAYTTLLLEYEGDVAVVTLNRPEKRNAISAEMIDELMLALDEIENSQSRVGILTGAGKAFCSGMDLEALNELRSPTGRAGNPEAEEEPQTEGVLDVAVRVLKGETEKETVPLQPAESALKSSRAMADLFRRIYHFPKPLIAAVNGPAIAGGCGLATLCDFTLASADAKFGYAEARIGFIPALVSVFLIRQVGEKRARALLLTGRIFEAEEASQLGLVNEVTLSAELMKRARQLAAQLMELSPSSLLYTKRLLRDFSEGDLDRELGLAIEENARIRSTDDFREGVSAFLEKRRPVWGRAPLGRSNH
jgi:methylglutaconyl-CoA hydratase